MFAWTGAAFGQLLDLDGGPRGDARFEQLDQRARALRAEAERLGRMGDARARAKAAWRKAAALLASVSGEDGDAAERGLLGLTMLSRRSALDDAIDHADEDRAWLAAVLFERLADEPSISAASAWNAVRDAVSVLGVGNEGPGWFLVKRERPLGDIPAEVSRALEGADGVYASSVARAKRLLGVSAVVLGPPGWVSDEAAARLAGVWRDAAAGLFEPERRADSVAVLERLAAWGALLKALDDGSRDSASVGARRAAVGAIVEKPGLLGGGAEWTDSLRMLAGLLRPIDLDEKSLLRPLRPVWRRVRLELLGAVRRQKEDLGRVLGVERPMTDPAVLSRVGVLRRARASALGIGALESLIAFNPDRPGAGRMRSGIDRRFGPVAARLIELARGSDAASLSALQDVLVWAGRNRVWPGENDLRTGSSTGREIERLTGEKAGAVLDEIDRARSAWLMSWANPSEKSEKEASDAARGDVVRAKRAALALLADAALLAPVRRGERGLRANAWPGFEMSRAVFLVLTETIEADAARSWRTPGVAAAMLEKHSAGRLIAAVERAVLDASGRDPTGRLSDLAAGSPIDSLCWGSRARVPIAWVCLSATDAGAGANVDDVKARAQVALDALGR